LAIDFHLASDVILSHDADVERNDRPRQAILNGLGTMPVVSLPRWRKNDDKDMKKEQGKSNNTNKRTVGEVMYKSLPLLFFI
jgi:hypothetical protein